MRIEVQEGVTSFYLRPGNYELSSDGELGPSALVALRKGNSEDTSAHRLVRAGSVEVVNVPGEQIRPTVLTGGGYFSFKTYDYAGSASLVADFRKVASPPAGSYDPILALASDEIFNVLGVDVTFEGKAKSLLKFGRSTQVQSGTFTTLWRAPSGLYNEVYVDDNLIDTLSSSSVSDAGSVRIEGHYDDGSGNEVFVIQDAVVNGQNKVTLSQALNRVSMVYRLGNTALLGDLYIYEDTAISGGVPTDTTKVHMYLPVGDNQSFKAATTISANDVWCVFGYRADMLTKSSTAVAEVQLERRVIGNLFRPLDILSTRNSPREFGRPVIIEPNSDVRLRAQADANNRDVAGSITGILGRILD